MQASRSRDLDKLLLRPGNLVSPNFEPGPQLRDDLQEYARILVVGAGGLGCKLLKDLALYGFTTLESQSTVTLQVHYYGHQSLNGNGRVKMNELLLDRKLNPRGGKSFDPANPDHMKWVYDEAVKRAELFGIPGATYSLTQGIVKTLYQLSPLPMQLYQLPAP